MTPWAGETRYMLLEVYHRNAQRQRIVIARIFAILESREWRMIGRSRQLTMLSRKVRAPEGKPPGNTWASLLIRERVVTDSVTENEPPAFICR